MTKAHEIYIPEWNEGDFHLETEDGRKYREWIDPESGAVIREFLESGVIRDYTNHKIIRGAITKENSKEMQVRATEARVSKAITSARNGLLRGVSATALANEWGIAWEYIVAAQAELAMAPDMGNASTRAAEFIMRAADLDPKNNKESLKMTDGKNKLELSNMSAEQLSSILTMLNRSDAVEVEEL